VLIVVKGAVTAKITSPTRTIVRRLWLIIGTLHGSAFAVPARSMPGVGLPNSGHNECRSGWVGHYALIADRVYRPNSRSEYGHAKHLGLTKSVVVVAWRRSATARGRLPVPRDVMKVAAGRVLIADDEPQSVSRSATSSPVRATR
jgi:hypothetical protein